VVGVRESGTFDEQWEIDAQGSYDNSGELSWNETTSTLKLDAVSQTADQFNLNEYAIRPYNAVMEDIGAAWTSFDVNSGPGGAFLEYSEPEFQEVDDVLTADIALAFSTQPLGSGGPMSILRSADQSVAAVYGIAVNSTQVPGYSSDPNEASTLFNGIPMQDFAFVNQNNPEYGTPPAPIGSTIPPVAYEKEPAPAT